MRYFTCLFVIILTISCFCACKNNNNKLNINSTNQTTTSTTKTTEQITKNTQPQIQPTQPTQPVTDKSEIYTNIERIWTIDTNKTDYAWLIGFFGTSYRDYGSELIINDDGTISYYIGSVGGSGNYTIYNNIITANITSYIDGDTESKIFKIVDEDGINYITFDIDSTTIWFVSKDN